jgi:diguanylate cyclase (GGDEF)-like protein/PAS domain S-box-containing protein
VPDDPGKRRRALERFERSTTRISGFGDVGAQGVDAADVLRRGRGVAPEAVDQSSTQPPGPSGQAQPAEAVAIVRAHLLDPLAVAEETLRAIRNGEVDALVVGDGASSDRQVFTLASADRLYRMFVENMRDGVATVSASGTVLYGNRRLAELLALPLEHILGSSITSFIPDRDPAELREIGERTGAAGTIETDLLASGGERIPVRVNTSTLEVDSAVVLCLTFADLTEQNAQRSEIDRLGRAQTKRMLELENAHTALAEQATHDALTGLPNRILLIDRITQALALARRSGQSTGLLFVDLDRFKLINDTRGHAAGDSVLRQVAERLLSVVRPMDSVSRLGGDEFVVLLPGMENAAGAVAVANRIAAAINVPIQLDHGTVPVKASIGISVTDANHFEHDPSPDSLLQHADTAMYYAKSLGGSRTELFDGESTRNILENGPDAWSVRIREALDEGRFVLHSQPIVELASGSVVQEELLLRMLDRAGELIPPLAFLPTAEKCGLITEIDQWVITQAAKIAARGPAVAVNLSATSAGDPGVLDLIERELHHHGTDPGKLVFEITETALMQNLDRARLFAERLVALGCRFALDDFGTGYASFTYLKRLPVQYLKIDIDFVRELSHNLQDMSVVRAIVGLAGDFGQRTIAEGIEDEQTANALRGLNVSFGQGYLYGRPSPISLNGVGNTVASIH